MFGVAMLLFGVLSLALTLTVSIRPWSWSIYWRNTRDMWGVGIFCSSLGFAIWRLTTVELRASLTQVNTPEE